MKVVIIVFSPSGHTLKVAEMIKNQCEKYTSSVRVTNITGKSEFLFENKKKENLQKELGEYDLLFIGGPIYPKIRKFFLSKAFYVEFLFYRNIFSISFNKYYKIFLFLGL